MNSIEISAEVFPIVNIVKRAVNHRDDSPPDSSSVHFDFWRRLTQSNRGRQLWLFEASASSQPRAAGGWPIAGKGVSFPAHAATTQ
jgi:hypothetical protein